MPSRPLQPSDSPSGTPQQPETRERLNAGSAAIEDQHRTRVKTNADMLRHNQRALHQQVIAQSTQKLAILDSHSKQNALFFGEGKNYRKMLDGLSDDELKLLEPIIAALTTAPPTAPQRGEKIEEPDEEAKRYLWVQNEGYRPDNPDDILLFTVNVNVAQLMKDRADVIGMLNRNLQGNPQAAMALAVLRDRMTLYAQQDVMRYLSHQQSTNQSYMSNAFGQMGKLLAVSVLGAYALADGIIALANKRMPTTGLAALGIAGLIADKRMRQVMFSSQEQVTLAEVDAVVLSDTFKELAGKYNFYRRDGAWVDVIEKLMDPSQQEDTKELLEKMGGKKGATRDETLARKQAEEFAHTLTPDTVIRGQLLKMILDPFPGRNKTDFALLAGLLQVAKDDVREIVVKLLREQATGKKA